MTARRAEPLRVGILGAARIAELAIVKPAHATGTRLVAVAARDRRRAEAFAAEHGVERATDSYADVLADPEVEVVYNPLPNAFHGPWNLAAVAAGKHVLSEKPFASTAEEAAEVRAAAQDAGVTVVEGFHYLFHPVMQRLFALLDSGELGELQHVEALVAMPEPDDGDPRWSFDLAGGALMDLGCYGLHAHRALGRWAGGEPELVDARAKERAGAPGVDEWLEADLRFPSGATGAVRCSMAQPRFEMTLRVVGSRGEATVMDFVQPHKDDRVVVRTRGRRPDRAPRHPLVVHLPARGVHPGAARRDADADRPGRRRGHRAADRPLLPRGRTSPAAPADAHPHRTKELTTMTDSELEPLPEGTFEKLRKVSTSTIATQLYKRGFRQPQLLGVKPLSEVADGFVGEAFTMRFIPMREDVDGLDPYRSGNTLQWDAFEALQPGQVLVVDSYRTATAASGGDMLMTRAWKRGAAAVVTDGGLRDGHVLAQMPFPTYASQVTITTRAAQHHVADLNVPIGCAGVAVYPGDVLIGDRDGVLVIPRHLAAEIAEQGYEQEQLEAFVSTKIHAGEPLWGNYPPGDELKAEYKASLAAADEHPS